MFITKKREPFYELVRPFMDLNKLVLDIGAGNGSFAHYFHNPEIYMIDGNIDTVEKYQTKFPNYFHSVLPTLPFNKNMFGIIHISHVLEHLEPQLVYETLKEIDRCLNIDGVLVISMPLLSDFFYDDLSHVKPYNPAVFLKYLTKNYSENHTRPKISCEYELIKLQYRYESKKILEYPEIPNKKFYWFLSNFFGFLKKIGIKKYTKTGYTLILKKG